MSRVIARRSAVFLIAQLASTGLSVAILPIATRVLGPADYGHYALATGVTTLLQGLAGAQHALLLPLHLPTQDSARRAAILGTATLLNMVVTGLLAALVLTVGPQFLGSEAGFLTPVVAGLLLLGAVASAPWTVAADAFPLEGRAAAFGAAVLAQALASTGTVLACIFWADRPDLALFAGYAAGSLASGSSALVAMARSSGLAWSAARMREAWTLTPAAAGQRAMEAATALYERSVVVSQLGATSVGLYSHAQLYPSLIMALVSTVSRGLTPTAMNEAREVPPAFVVTRRIWLLVQFFAAAAVIGFTLVGDLVISLLTHGKFVAAHVPASVLMLGLLVQLAGKAQSTYMLANGRGRQLSHINSVCLLFGALAFLALVPLAGVIGAAVAVVLRSSAQRLLLGYYMATRVPQRLPVQDGPLLAMVIAVAALQGVEFVIGLSATVRISMCVPLVLGCAGIGWPLARRWIAVRPTSRGEDARPPRGA